VGLWGLNGWLRVCGLDWTGSGQGPVAGYCDCGNEPSGSCATDLVMKLAAVIWPEII
jgi:hypothetical protein